jgi:FeS assembly protein IscX
MELHWEDDYAIALALMHTHPTVDPLDVDWAVLHQWVVDLPGFVDDRSVTAQYLLENIQREWYEEVASHEST